MNGASGSDVFVFRNGDGADEIIDFEIGSNLIDVIAFATDFTSPADLVRAVARASGSQWRAQGRRMRR